MPGNSSKLPTSLSAMSYNESAPEITLSPTKRCWSSIRRTRLSSAGNLKNCNYSQANHIHSTIKTSSKLNKITFFTQINKYDLDFYSACSRDHVYRQHPHPGNKSQLLPWLMHIYKHNIINKRLHCQCPFVFKTVLTTHSTVISRPALST